MRFGKITLENEEYTFGLPQNIYKYFLNDKQNNQNRLTLEQTVSECFSNHFNNLEKIFDDYIYIK